MNDTDQLKNKKSQKSNVTSFLNNKQINKSDKNDEVDAAMIDVDIQALDKAIAELETLLEVLEKEVVLSEEKDDISNKIENK